MIRSSRLLDVVRNRPSKHLYYRRKVATQSAVQASASVAAATSHPTTVLLSPLILQHQLAGQKQHPQQPPFHINSNNINNTNDDSDGSSSSSSSSGPASSFSTAVGRSFISASTSASARRLPSQPPASGWKKCIVSSMCLPGSSTPTTSSSSSSSSTTTPFSTDAAGAGILLTPPVSNQHHHYHQPQTLERNDAKVDVSNSEPLSTFSSSTSSTTTTTPSSSSSPMDELLLQVDMDELKDLASKRCTPLSLKDMYKYAVLDVDKPEQRLWNAQFLHKELPIRMAQRAYDLLTLPHKLNEAPAILQVAKVYLLYLERFQDCPVPNTVELEEKFTDMLQGMVLERSSIPNAIAKGVDDWMEQHSSLQSSLSSTASSVKDRERIREMDEALYRFFTARVGLRFLTEHHILSSPSRASSRGSSALRQSQSSFASIAVSSSSSTTSSTTIPTNPSTTTSTSASTVTTAATTDSQQQEDSSSSPSSSSSFLGCIQTNCEPVVEVRKVVDTIMKQTLDHYGICPEIQIVDAQQFHQQQSTQSPQSSNGGSKRNSRLQKKGTKRHSQHQSQSHNFTYVPHHLHYMVSELVKNSCRATVKRHLENPTTTPLGSIKIVVVKGEQDVTIKVADRGGGIPRSKMSKIWRFAHSTTTDEENSANTMMYESAFNVDEVTGTQIRGFGLPLARIYARYLGGELTLKSMEGYGVDAYLHLPRLGDACENLPLPVKFSPSNLSSNAPRGAVRVR
jgi:hypothetical protein